MNLSSALGRLRAEVRALEQDPSVEWLPKSRDGKWGSLTLRSLYGESGQFLTKGAVEKGAALHKYTPAGEACPNIRFLLNDLNTDVYLVRLLRLDPGELVKFHTDDVVFRDVRKVVRLHLPIFTSPSAVLRFGSPLQEPAPGYHVWRARQEMEAHIPAGELWYTNVNALHSVYNGGVEPRVHLVADVRPSSKLARALEEWASEREN